MATPHPSLQSSLRALPPAAWVLFFGTFLNKFGFFVIPFLTLYLTHRGYSLAAAGIALGAYGVGNLVASLLGGYLADRLGRRPTIVLSMFSGAVAMLVLSQARSLPAIDALAALTGLTNEMYRPACSALLADLVPAGQRVTAFSALRASFNAGFAFGPAVAGFLTGRGYFWLFIGDAATSALFGLVALAALPATTGKRARTVGWTELGQAISRDRALRWMIAAVFAAAIVYFQQGATLGLHVARLGFPTTTYGAILSLNGALVVLVELPLTTITRRFPARGVIALGFLLSGVGFALNGLAHTVPELVACMALFTLGEMLAMPMTSAYVADLAPESMRGRYMGVYGLAWPLALMVGPELGLAAFAFGGPALWLMCAGLGLLAALLVLGPTLASLAGFGSRPGPAPRPESG